MDKGRNANSMEKKCKYDMGGLQVSSTYSASDIVLLINKNSRSTSWWSVMSVFQKTNNYSLSYLYLKDYHNLGTGQICELMFYLLWHIHLVPLLIQTDFQPTMPWLGQSQPFISYGAGSI